MIEFWIRRRALLAIISEKHYTDNLAIELSDLFS